MTATTPTLFIGSITTRDDADTYVRTLQARDFKGVEIRIEVKKRLDSAVAASDWREVEMLAKWLQA